MNDNSSNSLTIEECRRLKKQTTSAIQDLLNDFIRKTGLVVEEIHLDTIYTLGSTIHHVVELEAKL